MHFKEAWLKNNHVNIHVLDNYEYSDQSLTPLLICPGLSEHAEEYVTLMNDLLPRRCVVLSFRGRGKSDTASSGYDLNDHIEDIVNVVNYMNVQTFYLRGYSRGVSYAIGYAARNKDRIAGLILEDYPAVHKEMPASWADDYIDNYLKPTGRIKQISETAVRLIQKESRQYNFWNDLNDFHFPVLILRGMKEGSLITEEDEQNYLNHLKDVRFERFIHSGHAIWNSEYVLFLETIKDFMNR